MARTDARSCCTPVAPARLTAPAKLAGSPVGLRARWDEAQPFADFVASARVNHDLWRDLARRAHPSMDDVARARALPVPRKLLVLLEDWCGDAVNTIPMLAALADAVPQLELRVLARDEHPDLMDRHLGEHGARAIPVVMVLDECDVERGWWGSRPAPLQAWVRTPEAQALPSGDRYREVRRWYARDRGLTTIDEVLTLLERSTDAAPRAA